MKYLLRAVALVLLSSLVFAQNVPQKTFTWTAPTERIDNTPLPDSQLAEFRIYCDGDSNPIWTQTNEPNDADEWQAPDGTFAVGNHSCHATAVDTGGRESEPSNSVPFSVTLANPKAPVFVLQ